jgi:hypothetical protein
VSLLPIRDWVYLGIIVALAIFGLYLREHLIAEGEARVHAAEQKAYAAQAQKDAENAKQTVSGLNAELQKLRSDALKPVPVVRLCSNPRGVQPSATAGRVGSAAPTAGSVPGVPSGADSVGSDIGPGLQRLADAADILSARDRALIDWAKK